MPADGKIGMAELGFLVVGWAGVIMRASQRHDRVVVDSEEGCILGGVAASEGQLAALRNK